jgi:ribosomal protein S18 acetylase RimI-like enzyme
MDELALSVRQARPVDAADLARIYIESWQDTYAGVLSNALLSAMSHKGQAARWQQTMRGPGAVLIAEDASVGPIGLASLGPARDKGLGLDGEIYTLYVDPAYLGMGAGRALLQASFSTLMNKKYRSCVIWSHARNNACYFYEHPPHPAGRRRHARSRVRLEAPPCRRQGSAFLIAARIFLAVAATLGIAATAHAQDSDWVNNPRIPACAPGILKKGMRDHAAAWPQSRG